MDQLYPQGYYFIHDNSKVHIAAQNWMKGQNFNLIKFPTDSQISSQSRTSGDIQSSCCKGQLKNRGKSTKELTQQLENHHSTRKPLSIF